MQELVLKGGHNCFEELLEGMFAEVAQGRLEGPITSDQIEAVTKILEDRGIAFREVPPWTSLPQVLAYRWAEWQRSLSQGVPRHRGTKMPLPDPVWPLPDPVWPLPDAAA